MNDGYQNNLDNNLENQENINQLNNEIYNNEIFENNGLNNQNLNNYMPYEYPSYDSNNQTNFEEEEKKNKRPLIIVLIIFIILLLLIFGFIIYKLVFSRADKNIILDSIKVEGGTINEEFSLDNQSYNIESINDSIKLICTYKGKKVNIDGCNKSILLTKNEIKNIKISFDNKDYNFYIVRLDTNAPIINNVEGIPDDWVKETTLKVEATFKLEQAEEAYSFDRGETWQKENIKTFTDSEDISILVKDIDGNISSIYDVKLDKLDSVAPSLIVKSIEGGVVTIEVKDDSSGITHLNVTSSPTEPTKWDEIELTNDTVIKYNATPTATYYAWAKDKVGNIAYQEFSLNEEQESNEEEIQNSEDNNTNADINSGSNLGSNNNTVAEEVKITSVAGNVKTWTNKVTLKVQATSNKSDAKLSYSFDGGKTYQSSNSKIFTSNQTVQIMVKNNNTGKTSAIKSEVIKYIDNTKPSCGKITGASTTWIKDKRSISVTCNDTQSGCKASSYSKTFNTTTKTSTITISDKVGNTKECSVNVYVDNTGPKISYQFITKNEKIDKFELIITDNESGLNLDSIKYKKKITKNAIDNVWHDRSSFDEEKVLTENKSYSFIKDVGIYNYFTITASDKLGNTTEIEISTK